MARKNAAREIVGGITLERAVRLYRFLHLLGESPQTRTVLVRKLKLGVRGFYRDLELLRSFAIEIAFVGRKYFLTESLEPALEKLPYPDPALTLGEARILAKGRSAAHKKLKAQIQTIESNRPPGRK